MNRTMGVSPDKRNINATAKRGSNTSKNISAADDVIDGAN